jgi:Predicted phosphohydrolases
MQRRDFLSSSLIAGCGLAGSLTSSNQSASAAEPDSGDAPKEKRLLFGHPVVSGPAPESLTILQGVNGPASGFVELAIGDQDFQRIDGERAGLLPYDANVLKFVLPPLPAGETIRYRVVARPIQFNSAYKIVQGEPEQTDTIEFQTLNPHASSTRFIIWNDTHENVATIRQLQQLTQAFDPDFLLWNGDQTNDVYAPVKMRGQYLSPGELEICAQWPMAYARGNHDVRGPAARLVSQFTGTPNDQFYYAFRSGPVAALVMDTGEDKPDDREVFAGLAGFAAMRERQRKWLEEVIQQDWFRAAPYRLLFCHIPLWWESDGKERDFWMCSEVCRELWLPLLEKGRVQLVVSGHTHQSQFLPRSQSQSIPQLIGGGPQQERATIIEGIADEEKLTIRCKSLTGEIRHEVEIRAT